MTVSILRLIKLLLLLVVTAGFRPISGPRWDVSRDQPTVWIELDEELYGAGGFGDKVDGLKGVMASVATVPEADQRSEIWRLIMEDFDSVQTAFLSLRLKPGQIDSIDETHDEVYDDLYAETRTISIVVGSSRGAASGYASPETSGNQMKGCKVVIASRTLEDPLFFAHVLTHEILHCLGLGHQQDDSDSLMSYSNNSFGLSVEERMALTHLYPLDPSYAKESPTLGLACKPAN